MYNLHDVVYCRSGDGNNWIGYICKVYRDNDIIINWWSSRSGKWHKTMKFQPNPNDPSFAVVGPLPWDVVFDAPES